VSVSTDLHSSTSVSKDSESSSCLVVTPGEPAGIGPDLILQYAHSKTSIDSSTRSGILIIADISLLKQRAKSLNLDISLQQVSPNSPLNTEPNVLNVLHTELSTSCVAGELNHGNAAYVLRCLDLAVDLCLEDKNYALVTGPVHKGNINDAGIAFSGHTEYLAERAGIRRPVMMLATTGLRVALATTHLPLAKVCSAITQPLLEEVLTVLHSDLSHRFQIKQPRIIVCGLNPHAGESGHLGKEEINIIEPVINRLKQQGMQLTGPLPADTAFTPKHMQHTDAYLAMYHDQGLPVLKHIGFGHAVNITLGLPFVRTSVDHGTALELAATGKADISSLQVALSTAQQMQYSESHVR